MTRADGGSLCPVFAIGNQRRPRAGRNRRQDDRPPRHPQPQAEPWAEPYADITITLPDGRVTEFKTPESRNWTAGDRIEDDDEDDRDDG